MSLFEKNIVISSLLFLSLCGCASNPKAGNVEGVIVAEYGDSDEAIAENLTFGVLHRHGIMAGGAGNAGGMCVNVLPDQVKQAHKILEEERAELSQAQRDSFRIVWDWEKGNVNALDFLSDIPSLKKIKSNMSEAKFLAILHRAKLDYKVTTASDQTNYWVKPNSQILVMCRFRNGQCCSAVRIDGCDDKSFGQISNFDNRPSFRDNSTKQLSAREIVEQMRGLNMQPTASPTPDITDDGRVNPKEQHRKEIIQQLRSVGKEAVPALIHVLDDSDVQLRRNAELVMIILAGGYDGQAKMDIRDAVPALIKATQDKDSDVRAWAAHALAEVGPNAVEAVPALMKLLGYPYTGARNDACIALGDIGSAASAALPTLEVALHDANGDVHHFAEQAIKKIQGP